MARASSTDRPDRTARGDVRGAATILIVFVGGLASPGIAVAQPATVTGCAFDALALATALDIEQQGAARRLPPITVTCADDAATVTLHHDDGPATTRVVDLVDVPGPLAPRVVALVAVAAANEPAEPPPDASHTPEASRSENPTAAPSMVDPRGRDGGSPRTDATPSAPSTIEGIAPRPAITRATLLDGGFRARPLGMSARGLTRMHSGSTTLWGASAAGTAGPASLGLVVAGTRVDHALGTLTPWIVAADVGVTVACAGAACAGLRGEVGRVTVQGSTSDPMAVSTRSVGAMYLHGAAELSLGTTIAGVEVAASAALGTSRGVIARADQEAAAVVAGWTLTGALEVRR